MPSRCGAVSSLRRWFEQLPFDDRPAFLFEEERQPVLPDGSDIAEMTGLKAIALRAHLLASSSAKYKAGEPVPCLRPRRVRSDAIRTARTSSHYGKCLMCLAILGIRRNRTIRSVAR